jgi:hypothetical protein
MARKSLWFFHRIGPGEIKRISNPSMQRFLVGERALHPDGDGFVRCIGLSVELQKRRPTSIARVWFSKIRVRSDGRVDPHHHHETHKLAALAESPRHPAHAESVIPAGHRFAQRRLSTLGEWQPEQPDIDALRALVSTESGDEEMI